jgi:SAM-dependent methyltransferase
MSDALYEIDRWATRRNRIVSFLRERGIGGVVAKLRERGLADSLRYAIGQFRYTLCIMRGRAWDRKHGVETGGHIELDDLAVVGENKALGATFVSSSPKTFNYLARYFPKSPGGYVYIDFGSGKGRTLFLAALAGFRRIIGVEFSGALCDKARDNVHSYLARHTQQAEFSIEHADATEYRLPPDDLVLYFASPFQLELWHKMIANIVQSLSDKPRRVVIIVSGSHHDTIRGVGRLLEAQPLFNRVAHGPAPYFVDTYLPYYFECFVSANELAG